MHTRFIRRSVSTLLLLLPLFALGCNAQEIGSQETGSQETDNREAAATIHPAFDLSRTELSQAVETLPEGIQHNIEARPQFFLELMRRALRLPEAYLRLVDKTHPLPKEYRPDDLIYLAEYRFTLNRDDLRLSRACLPDLLAMVEAARADGVELVLSSTYRSYNYQKGLYERYVRKHGKEEADRFSARPGTSQHQLGLTLDFGSISKEIVHTAQGKWLEQHAWEYGFSLSYPEGKEELTGYMYEPWHFRYLSRTGTRLQHEFFGGIQQHLTEYLHEKRAFFTAHLNAEE